LQGRGPHGQDWGKNLEFLRLKLKLEELGYTEKKKKRGGTGEKRSRANSPKKGQKVCRIGRSESTKVRSAERKDVRLIRQMSLVQKKKHLAESISCKWSTRAGEKKRLRDTIIEGVAEGLGSFTVMQRLTCVPRCPPVVKGKPKAALGRGRHHQDNTSP